MAEQRILTTSPIANGISTVSQGDGKPASFDSPAFAQHIPSGDSLTLFQVQDTRYRHKGASGEFPWER